MMVKTALVHRCTVSVTYSDEAHRYIHDTSKVRIRTIAAVTYVLVCITCTLDAVRSTCKYHVLNGGPRRQLWGFRNRGECTKYRHFDLTMYEVRAQVRVAEDAQATHDIRYVRYV